MTAPRVRADYDILRQMSAGWRQQASETTRSLQALRSQMQTLEGGDWEGKGAKAFYSEMNSDVLPTMQRLANALNVAADTTQKISDVMKQAEDEAASYLKADGAGLLGGIGAAVAAAAAGLAGEAAKTGVGGAAGAVAGGVAGAAGAAAAGAAGAAGVIGAGVGGAVAKAAADAAKAAAVQAFIDKGDKAGAIAEAIKQYGVDTSSAKAGSPVYSASTSGEGATSKDGNIKIGDKAFSSPGWLASSIGHEHVHAQQAADRWYTGPQGTLINEIEAYDWEIKNASRFNLSAAEIKELQSRRDAHYNGLNADNKKIIDGGAYTLPAGKTGT